MQMFFELERQSAVRIVQQLQQEIMQLSGSA